MSDNRITRRHFFYGALLAGAIPAGGFGRVPSLKFLGYQSPNEKLNIAGIGAGAQAFNDLRGCETENIVAWPTSTGRAARRDSRDLTRRRSTKTTGRCWTRSGRTSTRWSSAFRITITRQPLSIACSGAKGCMSRSRSPALPRRRSLLYQAAQKYKVATQMGNQGYSHEATRVACEIFWSGEIGEVREVHAWRGRPQWPQGMTKTPPPTPVPANAGLGSVAGNGGIPAVHRRRPGVQGLRGCPQRSARRRCGSGSRRRAGRCRGRGGGRARRGTGRPRRWRPAG